MEHDSPDVFTAAVTVFHVAGRSKLENELRLDLGSNTVTVGRVKLKISDLIKKPTEANGKITLVSKRHRILAASTPSTRELLASVTEAWQNRTSEQNSPRLDPPKELPTTSSKVNDSKSGGVARASRSARGHLREVTNTDTNSGDGRAIATGSSEAKIQLGDEAKAAAIARGRAGIVGTSDDKSKRKSNNARRRRSTSPSNTTMPRAYAPTNTLHQTHRPPPSTIRKKSGGILSGSSSSNSRRDTLGSLLGNTSGGGGNGGSGRRGRQIVQYAVKPRGATAVTGSAANRSGDRGADGGSGGQRLGGTTLRSPPLLRCISGSVGSGVVSRSSGGDDSDRKRQQEQGQKRGSMSTLKPQQAADGGSSEGGDGMPLAASDLRDVTMGDHREKRRRRGHGDGEEISRISGTGTPPPHSGEVVSRERRASDPRKKRMGLSGAISTGRDGMHGRSDRMIRGQYGQSLARPIPTPEWRAGFRNMGNTCYINACLQGLLSLAGFVSDLQRKCWVLAMLKPDSVPLPQVDQRDGKEPATTAEKQRRPPSASLYDALLRVSLVAARGSHGVMSAAPLKRAMDRHSSRFAGNFQQDAHEFLSDLINVLHEETEPRVDVTAAALTAGSNDSTYEGDGDSGNAKQGLWRKGTAAGMKTGTAAPAPLAVAAQGGVKTSMTVDLVPSEAAKQDNGKDEKVVGASEVEFRDKMDAHATEAVAATARKKELMPTTRHFHAEVEVTLTCMRCAYSRRRREPYRDFSLDLPEQPPIGQDVSGLEYLLEGFFRPKVLNLKCERCGHDTVRAEHSLAALPGTLVVHIKRFKAVVQPSTPPSVRTTAVTDLTGMENDSSAATATVASAAAENRGSKGASDDGARVSSRKTEASSCLAGVSYEKTMERVSVPLELDLTRFCTEFTGNAPSDDLGQRVDSLEAVGIPANPSSLSSSFSSGDSVSGDPASGTHKSASKSAGGSVGLKRFSAEISVDLSSREGWKEGEDDDRNSPGSGGSGSNGNKRIRGSGREGDVSMGIGREQEVGGKEACPAHSPSRSPSSNSVGAGVAVGSGRREGWGDGADTFASPVPRWGGEGGKAWLSENKGHAGLRKGRSALQEAKEQKEREKQARATGSADRWSQQENKTATTAAASSDKAVLRQHPANKNVFVDDKGRIDYFHSISKPSPANDHLSPRRYGSGRGTAGRGSGGMGGYGKSEIAVGAVARGGMTGGYARRPGGRQYVLETDEEERKQLQAAIAASREDAKNSHSPYFDVDSESDLGRALLIGQEDDQSGGEVKKGEMVIGARASASQSGRAGPRGSGEEHGPVDEEEDPVPVKMETTIAAERVGSGRGVVRGTRGPVADVAGDLDGAAAAAAAAAAKEDEELQQALLLSMMDTGSSASASDIGKGPAYETSAPDCEWACDQCTFRNDRSSSFCEVCGHARSSAAKRDQAQQPQQPQQQQQPHSGEAPAVRHVQSLSRCTDSSDGATTTTSPGRAVEDEAQLHSQDESSRKLAHSVLDGLRARSRVPSSPRRVVEGDGQMQSQDESSRKLAQSVLDGLRALSRVSSSPLGVVEGDEQLQSQDESSRNFAQSVVDELRARCRVSSSPLGVVEGDGQLPSRDESSRKFAQSVLDGLRAGSVVPRSPLGVVESNGQSRDLAEQERLQRLAQGFEGYYQWHGQELQQRRMVEFAQSLLDEMDCFHGVTGSPLEVMGGDLHQREYVHQEKQEQKKLTDYLERLTYEMDSVHKAEQSRAVGEERKRSDSGQKRRRAVPNENGDDSGHRRDGDGDDDHDEHRDAVNSAVVPMLSSGEETAMNGTGSNNDTKDMDKDEDKEQTEEACKGLLKCLVAALDSGERAAPQNSSAPALALSSPEVGGVMAKQQLLASSPPAPSPQQQQTRQSAGRGNSREAAAASSSTAATHAASTDTASPPREPRQSQLRARYQLRSVLHHLGRHAFAGHYVTDVRDDTGTIKADSQNCGGVVDRGGGGDKGVHGKAQGGARMGGVARGECDEIEVVRGGGWKRHNDSFVDSVTEAEALEGDSQRSCYICFYSLAGE